MLKCGGCYEFQTQLFTMGEKRKTSQQSMMTWPKEFCNLQSPFFPLFFFLFFAIDGPLPCHHSRTTTANRALCHRFPVHRLCARQLLTASWGAIQGWVSCLLLHPLLILAAVQSALTASGQVDGLRYIHEHSTANKLKTLLMQTKNDISLKHDGKLKLGKLWDPVFTNVA